MPDDVETRRAHQRFKELGADAVRQLLATDAFPSTWRLLAADWLAGQAAVGEPDHAPAGRAPQRK
jgi:hypothetical protein